MRLIPLDQLTAADREAWVALAGRALEPNPFFEPNFVDAATADSGSAGIALLVTEEAGTWAGCLPVELRRAAGLPLLASTWRSPYTYLGTPLVDRDRIEAFAAALVASLRRHEHCRVLLLRRTSVGPVLAALDAAAAEADVVELFEAQIERGAYTGRDADRQLDWIKSKRRSEMKRQRRKLGEEVEAKVTITVRSDVEAAIADFLRLEASGWKGDRGTALGENEASARFFAAMCRSFAAADRLRISSLQAGDRVLAMTCDLLAGEVLFGFKSAYDEELRRYSPGVQLQVENFTRFDADGAHALFDSCAEPDNEMINGLWPDRRPLTTVALGRRGLTGKLLGRALERAYLKRTS
jgi:CelD/BcsL family acetyltransferase involved in cellulose biosynthesis